MPRKPPLRRSRSSAPPPAPTEEVAVDGEHDLADRRDLPPEGHANVGPDDRSPGHADDIEAERADRVPDVDAWVVERVADHTDTP